jgi:transposase
MRNVCGLDVHKDSVFVCVLNEEGVIFQEKYGVLTPELAKMSAALEMYGVEEVCMESTSIYWMPVWRVLEPSFSLKLVNPYFIRQLPGRKSDVKDAEWIATCLLKDLIRGSYVPGDTVQRLRQYDRRISDLNREIVYKLAKLDAALQRCNIRLSNYVSNVDSKSYREVVKLLAEGVSDPERLVAKVHGRTVKRWGRETVKAALTGVVTEVDSEVISQLRDELELATGHRAECQSRMAKMCNELFPKQMHNLQTIPGVSERAATAILAEAGTDLSSFQDAAHLVSWAGLRPRNDESAGKIKSRGITHGNKYLRKTLIEVSWAARRTQGSFFSKFSYTQTVIRRKPVMKVQVAIARKTLVAVWFVLHDGAPYIDPSASDTASAQKQG